MKYLALGAAVAMAAALAGSIRIGFNAPLTGFAAADGNSALVGARLAVEQVNAAGGTGQIRGVALVAGVLSVLPLFLEFVDDYKLLLYGVLVFATMRFAPGGVAMPAELPLGDLKRLEVARALALEPGRFSWTSRSPASTRRRPATWPI